MEELISLNPATGGELARLPIAGAVEIDAGVIAPSLAGEHIDLDAAAFGFTRREPVGAVTGIGARDYPLQIACWKSAPAFACGNAILFKPTTAPPRWKQ